MMQSGNEVISAPVSIYLLAENRLLRETLARLLEKRGGLSIAGVSRYTESTLEEIFASGCAILLIDSMATRQATNVLSDLSERAPKIEVILFGMDQDLHSFVRSACLAVCSYVVKES